MANERGNVSPLKRLKTHSRILTGGFAALHTRLSDGNRYAVAQSGVLVQHEMESESCGFAGKL